MRSAVLISLGLLCGPLAAYGQDATQVASSPTYGDAFWRAWGDGKAELAAYDLTFPRYGEARKGTAVSILVSETFSNAPRVKSDARLKDAVPVLKLNLLRDFPTGIYDYHLMTSAFVALADANGAGPGYPTKVSFTGQEWCGHVYHQVLFDADGVREQLHSYFEGEADQARRLARPAGGLSEDALLIWARGLAAPALTPGESRTVPMLGSLQTARLRHAPLAWTKATLSRDKVPQRLEVPAGAFDVDVLRVALASGVRWTFYVERAAPRRVVRWETSDGERADLLAAKRLAYWKLHQNGGEKLLESLGLTPRPRRTP